MSATRSRRLGLGMLAAAVTALLALAPIAQAIAPSAASTRAQQVPTTPITPGGGILDPDTGGGGTVNATVWCTYRFPDGSCGQWRCVADARSDCSYFFFVCTRQNGDSWSGDAGSGTCSRVL